MLPRRWAFASGACGAAVALGCWSAAYAFGCGVYPPLDIADAIIRSAPGALDTWAIDSFGHSAQRLLTIATTIGFALFGGVSGLLLRIHQSRTIAAAGALLLLPALVAMSIAADAWPGSSNAAIATVFLGLGLIAGGGSAGWWAERWARIAADGRTHRADADSWLAGTGTYERRALLRHMVAVSLGVLAGGVGLRWVVDRSGAVAVATSADVPLDQARAAAAVALGLTALPSPTTVADLPTDFAAPANVRPRSTSTADFYIVDISTRDPVLPESEWALRVLGLVNQPITIGWEELLAMPATELQGTQMCISYTHGSDLISTTRWTGVPLRDVLQRAGLADGVVDVVLRGKNGYSDSIPLAKALEPTTLLAYGMDGRTLPRRHGFPCRVYVPGLYGEKSVKWLESIELVDNDYFGYWQERGWTDIAVINTISTIDAPSGAASRDAAGTVPVGGIAFAGSRGISAVELQIDGGDWLSAEIEEYDPQLVWQRWRYDWRPDPGKHRLAVRAVDGEGTRQIETDSDPHPNGLTGLYRSQVRII